MRIVLIVIMAILIYFQGVKPIIADYYSRLYKSGNPTAIYEALKWSPENTQIQYDAGQILKAIETSNGDLTAYAMWFTLASLYHRSGNIEPTRKALMKSLWYYPNYEPAKELMSKING